MAVYHRGDIVYARVADPGGLRIDHDHPVIIWTATEKIPTAAKIHVVVVSSQITTPHPRGHIPMPWRVGGHPITGLSKPCVAKCNWTPALTAADLHRHIGVTPTAIMEQIYVELIARLQEKRAATSDGGANLPK